MNQGKTGKDINSLQRPCVCNMSLPAVIDGVVAVNSLRSQHVNLLSLIPHSLLMLTESLNAGGMVSREVYDIVCNDSKGVTQRAVALLNCLEGRIQAVPADFAKLLDILHVDSYLDPLHKYLLQSYSECLL